MAFIHEGDRFVNVRTGTVIQAVTSDEGGRLRIATVNAHGRLTSERTVNATSLKLSSTNRLGRPWKTGYVAIGQLPADHPYAPRPERLENTVSFTEEEPDFDQMNDAALVAYIDRTEARAKQLTDLAEQAKDAKRSRTTRAGTEIHGKTAVVASPNHRFDGDLAKKNLPAAWYRKICVTKPDAKEAKKLLEKAEPELYRSVLKVSESKPWKITVRPATEEEMEAAAIRAELAES